MLMKFRLTSWKVALLAAFVSIGAPVFALTTDDPIVSIPKCGLTYTVPSNPNGVAIIQAAGGGYCFLTGADLSYTDMLKQLGVTVITIDYDIYQHYYAAGTTPTGEEPGLYPIPMLQIDRAVRRVRRDAPLYGINPNKIGVMGFSAGAHVITYVATHFQPGDPTAPLTSELHYSSRPDFHIPVYPLLTMEKQSFRPAVLGRNQYDEDIIRELTYKYHVTPATPKALVSHGTQDSVVSIDYTREYVDVLRQNGVMLTYTEPSCNHGGFGWDYATFRATLKEWLETYVIPDCAHPAYGAVSYTWNDDDTTCTAARICTTCGDAEWEVATPASEVTVEPTATTAGVRTLVATFQNGTFASQTKTVELPATAATYRLANAGYTWAETTRITTYEANRVVAYTNDVFVCTGSNTSVDGSSTETEEVVATYSIVTPATTLQAGVGRYTAVFKGSMFATQTKDVVIPQKQSPRFTGDWYVSPEGSDLLYDGKTPDTPLWTITKALERATDGETIVLLPGLHEINGHSAAYAIDKGVTVIGSTGNPADVVIRNNRRPDTSAPGPYRVFEINHANAVLSGVAVEGGAMGGIDKQGGNILIDTKGGMVTNCVIRGANVIATDPNGGMKSNANGAGIACLSDNGVITHCVVTNNAFTRGAKSTSTIQGGAAGVFLSKGKLLNSLIAYNTTGADGNGAAVSLANSSVMENCTVAANGGGSDTTGNFSPVVPTYANNAPKIRNTLIYGNADATGANNLLADTWVSNNSAYVAKLGACYENCATDATIPSAFASSFNLLASGISVTSAFRPTSASSLVDAGAEMTVPVARDLAGKKRVSGTAVDIGCYEYIQIPEHDCVYGEPMYAWSYGYASCTATRRCTICEEADEETTMNVEQIDVVAPTCTQAGSTTYTATFARLGSATTTAPVPATGHAYAEVTYAWAADGSTCTAESACGVCGFSEPEGASAVTSDVTKEPTASTAGERTFTATFAKYPSATKVVPIAAHAHDYSTAVYRFGDDHAACTATFRCDVCGYEASATASEIAREVTKEATEDEEGVCVYTARFPAPFPDRSETVALPKRGSADYFVSTTGSDTAAGTSRADAFATIAKAVSVAADGQTVCVLKGAYEVSSAISLAKSVTVFGETGKPEDVVVRNTSKPKGDYVAHHVFEINHSGAVLSSLVVEGGYYYNNGATAQQVQGGNIFIDTNGGTVTNCIVRNADMTSSGKTKAGGSGIYCDSVNGLVTHCVITNNSFSFGDAAGGNFWDYGGVSGVCLKQGKLLHSLIAHNTVKNHKFGTAVLVGTHNIDASGTLMENCTVANNHVHPDSVAGSVSLPVMYCFYQYNAARAKVKAPSFETRFSMTIQVLTEARNLFVPVLDCHRLIRT